MSKKTIYIVDDDPKIGELFATVLGREEGAPPPVDLALEKRTGDFVRSQIGEGSFTAVHDLSDGGLLVALAEMAMASGIGARLEAGPAGLPSHAFWFGEDQARYVVAVDPKHLSRLEAAAAHAGVALTPLGTTGGAELTLPGTDPILVSTLQAAHEGWLPDYMKQPA